MLNIAGSNSRMRALLSKFETETVKPPPPPTKERFQSTLDAPKPELNKESADAKRRSATAVAEDVAAASKRYVPKIGPTDSEEVRELKRKIQAKEQEILDITAKFRQISDRLTRVVDIFTNASVEEAMAAAPPPKKSNSEPTKAFQSNSELEQTQKEQAPKKTTSISGNSVEAILAAARSGSSRAQSERPKYAKLMRDLK